MLYLSLFDYLSCTISVIAIKREDFEREYGKYESGIIAPKSAGIRRGY